MINVLKPFIFFLFFLAISSCMNPETSQKTIMKKDAGPSGNSSQEISPPSENSHPLAFDYLPKAGQGYVDWVQALRQGIIHPKDSLTGEAENSTMAPLDFNIIFKAKGNIADVVYPHLAHTEWLDCRNCHPGIFKMQAGSNPVTMAKIFQGEFCGRCHGKVSFPLSDCARCHSKPKN